jgi:hypothetical protein
MYFNVLCKCANVTDVVKACDHDRPSSMIITKLRKPNSDGAMKSHDPKLKSRLCQRVQSCYTYLTKIKATLLILKNEMIILFLKIQLTNK